MAEIRHAFLLLPLLFATTTTAQFFKNPWYDPTELFSQQPTYNFGQSGESGGFNWQSLVPNLFAPTPNQKVFDAKQDESGDVSDVTAAAAPSPAFTGSWEIMSPNAGVSAMHLIIRPNNRAVYFDTFIYGSSAIALPPGNCRPVPGRPDDCWAHAVEMDLKTAAVRPLKMLTDPWCSSGGLGPDGTLVNTGGFDNGIQSVRYLGMCDNCDWGDTFPNALAPGGRWYATQQILPDTSFVLIGGRRAFSYEIVPPPGQANPTTINLDFLQQTTDPAENNLYPFVHLLPDGNLFIFANNRSILLNPGTGKVLREYPVLTGGSRNYPPSGMSALLPLDLRNGEDQVNVEVIVCGGGSPQGMDEAAKNNFLPAINSCGRIDLNMPNPKWAKEDMPMGRIMGDMLLLPNAEVLIINGASRGVSGWWFARYPVLKPVLYKPNEVKGKRFSILARTEIPRVYHSTSAVLPDATIMVAGSNTNNAYNFTGVLFPTELRVERFRPPYFDPILSSQRPVIDQNTGNVAGKVAYGGTVEIKFTLDREKLKDTDFMVTMYYPPFTTHGFSQGQRLLILKTQNLVNADVEGNFVVTALVPTNKALAPPGHYLIYLVNGGVPSEGIWIQLQ